MKNENEENTKKWRNLQQKEDMRQSCSNTLINFRSLQKKKKTVPHCTKKPRSALNKKHPDPHSTKT